MLESLRTSIDSTYNDARHLGTRAWDDARQKLETTYRTIRDEFDTIRRESQPSQKDQ